VAIVGPTGAGKTTLVNLLMRFYEVTSGRITVDGVDIAHDPRDLRSNVGMVLQDTWLFGGTIADNIAYGANNPTRERVIEAAQAATPTASSGPCRTATLGDRRGGLERQRWREAAADDRPGVPVRAGDPGAGRGDQFGGHPTKC